MEEQVIMLTPGSYTCQQQQYNTIFILITIYIGTKKH
jgi:hypothetical protein